VRTAVGRAKRDTLTQFEVGCRWKCGEGDESDMSAFPQLLWAFLLVYKGAF